jgi:uncharacterized phage-like protein YoqJ
MGRIVTLEEAATSEGGTLSGTGHRPDKLGGYYVPNPTHTKVMKKTGEVLDLLKPVAVISGMALGFDTILAQCTLQKKIPLIAAVPFQGFHLKWPEQSQRAFLDLLKQCEEVHYVCDGGYAAWKMQKRNEWMVDNSEIQLAMWDGSEGGTKNCYEYALKKASSEFEIVRINPKEL